MGYITLRQKKGQLVTKKYRDFLWKRSILRQNVSAALVNQQYGTHAIYFYVQTESTISKCVVLPYLCVPCSTNVQKISTELDYNLL